MQIYLTANTFFFFIIIILFLIFPGENVYEKQQTCSFSLETGIHRDGKKTVGVLQRLFIFCGFYAFY